MSGIRHNGTGARLGGRMPADRRIVLPPGVAEAAAAGVPLIAQPHQVRLQCLTSDAVPPTVIELATAFAGLLIRVNNWAEPIELIKSGRERQAMAMGDGPATIEVLRVLDRARTRLLEIGQDVQARTAAAQEPEPEAEVAPEPVVDPEPVQAATEDRPPITREALAARLGIPEPEAAT